jgi:hypothetical protein
MIFSSVCKFDSSQLPTSNNSATQLVLDAQSRHVIADSNGVRLQRAGTFCRGHYGRVAKPHMSNKVVNIFSQATGLSSTNYILQMYLRGQSIALPFEASYSCCGVRGPRSDVNCVYLPGTNRVAGSAGSIHSITIITSWSLPLGASMMAVAMTYNQRGPGGK